MPLVLTDYRSDVLNNLASAADASKWTPTMIDTALRQALAELNSLIVYEASFTVITAGNEHILTTITSINTVLGVAYPWVDGAQFGQNSVEWRFVGNNIIYLHNTQPAVGEIIRVRYTKLHLIDDLDSAASTTVPDDYRVMVGLLAAAFACEMRLRQSGELHLGEAALRFRERAEQAISQKPPLGRLRWGSIGLD